MPAMQLDALTDDGKFTKDLPEGTNLGPVFMKVAKTGNLTRDVVPTQLGRKIKAKGGLECNAKLKQMQYKIYLILTKDVKAGDKLVLCNDLNDLPSLKQYFIK